MNYYIQGNKEKNSQIRAAFEKLGYDINGWNFDDEQGIYYTSERKRIDLACGKFLINLIKTHPDYQELELPIEPKFKVGDWVVFNNSHNSIYQISEIRDSYYMLAHTHGGSMPLPFSQGELLRPWTIDDAKDGDILVDEYTDTIGIFEETNEIYWNSKIYCAESTHTKVYHHGGSHHIKLTKPATKEQRDLLFAKMKEAGYQWDANKKELRKIQPHYDIANYQPFDKVLVRDGDMEYWNADLFSSYHDEFHCFRGSWEQCIPYNDDTKHLLGTTDMCDEQYINW